MDIDDNECKSCDALWELITKLTAERDALRQQLAEQTSSKTSSEEYQSWKQIIQEAENIKYQITEGLHDSDCAVHNEPAYPNGPCNCILSPRPSVEVLLEALRVIETGHYGRFTTSQKIAGDALATYKPTEG
jgi:regulator of replication initiation timing